MSNKVLIYTDGSCDKNPGGNGGYSSIIFIDKKPIFISGYENNTTNQRMEIKAVIQALVYIDSFDFKDKEIIICSDSAYVCNCFFNRWFDLWINNNWKNSKGTDVCNRDLWEELFSYISKYNKIKFVKVKGHTDNIFNNKCDELAKDIVSFKKTIDSNVNILKDKV